MEHLPKLLPCPFCGSTGLALVLDHDNDALVECGSCSACGPAEQSRDLAAEAWNRRASPAVRDAFAAGVEWTLDSQADYLQHQLGAEPPQNAELTRKIRASLKLAISKPVVRVKCEPFHFDDNAANRGYHAAYPRADSDPPKV